MFAFVVTLQYGLQLHSGYPLAVQVAGIAHVTGRPYSCVFSQFTQRFCEKNPRSKVNGQCGR